MSIAKVIEVIAEGDSVEKAMKSAVKEASKTVKNIKHVYTDSVQGLVKNEEIQAFRVNCKVTFVIGD